MGLQWQDFIEERKEVFKGTRITVQHVLEELGSGMSFDDLLDNYPTLRPEHVRAALQYAAAVVGMDQSIYDCPAQVMKYLADENVTSPRRGLAARSRRRRAVCRRRAARRAR